MTKRYTVKIELEDGALLLETVEADSETDAENKALDSIDARVRNYVISYWAVLEGNSDE